MIKTLEKQKFAPKFLFVFNDLYYLGLKDGSYIVSPLLDENQNNEFSFEFVDEIQDRIYTNGNRLIAQGKEKKKAIFILLMKRTMLKKFL